MSGHRNSFAGSLLVFAAFLSGLVTTAACAQAVPVLVARPAPSHLDGWCGDHAVRFQDSLENPFLLDVLSGKELSLKYRESSGVVLSCSPDGRWVLTQNSVRGDKGLASSPEGGDPSCNPPDKISLSRLVLWDTKDWKRWVVGRGETDSSWSPSGDLLLYSFRPICDLELDPRSTFKLPPGAYGFKAESVLAMVRKVLGPSSGWPDKGRVGVVRWYAHDAFLVQLPVSEGMWLTDATDAGAVLAVHIHGGEPAQVEQINPTTFQSSWKLAIPQASQQASDEVLKAASGSSQ